MKHKNCSFIFYLLISALVIFDLDADTGEDSDCYSEIKVRRNTKYEAVLGEDFRIVCPVAFCFAAPPEVRWYKDEDDSFNAVVSSDGHTEVEWKHENEFAGKSYLIFRNIQKNDEGFYRCQIPDNWGHNINVTVNGDCHPEITVRRNTVYEAFLGQELRINCSVVFCDDLPPKISWHKLTHTGVRVGVISKHHVKTEVVNELEGKSYLIIQRALRSDSGRYQCRSGGSVSHVINVVIKGDTELTTAPALTTESPTQSVFLHYMHRVIGILAFFTVVIMICVTSHRLRKGKSQNTAAPSLGPSDPIYENEPVASVSAQLGPS